MSALCLPSFERHPWTPALPEGPGIQIQVAIEESPGAEPICVLAGSYRLPADAGLHGDPLAALVVVAINRSSWIPRVRQLSPSQLAAAPGPEAGHQGVFALDLLELFSLRGRPGWFTVVCSIDGWVSEPVKFESLGGTA